METFRRILPCNGDAGASFSATTTVPYMGTGAAGIYHVRYRLLDSERALQREGGETLPWVVQPAGEAAQLLVENWSEDILEQPRLAMGLSVESEYVANHSIIPIHVSVENLGDEPFSGTVHVSGPCPSIALPVEVAAGGVATFDSNIGPLRLALGHDGGPGGGYIRAYLYASGSSQALVSTTKSVLTNVRFMNVEIVPTQSVAGPGDELVFMGSMNNLSPGALEGRYRFVFSNWSNPVAASQHSFESEWQDFSLSENGSFSFAEPFTVPADWRGRMSARLLLCYPDLGCWMSGQNWGVAMDSWAASVDLPMPKVELTMGTPTMVEGPAFRIPVQVQNLGTEFNEGQLKVWQANWSSIDVGPEAFSETFDLQAGEISELMIDLPYDPRLKNKRWSTHVAFTNPHWQQTGTRWVYRVSSKIEYGADVKLTAPLEALPGDTAIRSQLAISNESSFAQTFSLHIVCDAYSYTNDLSVTVEARQVAHVDLEIPLPEAAPYDSNPVTVHLVNGAGLAIDKVFYARYSAPGVRLAVAPFVEPPRAGFDLVVEASGAAELQSAAIAGTIELVSESLGFAETRALSLPVGERVTTSFSIPLAADLAAGSYGYVLRWREANGNERSTSGKINVRAAHFEAAIQQEMADAGGVLAYELLNSGGSKGSVSVTWQLYAGRTIVADEQIDIEVQNSASEVVNFALPASLPSANYISELLFDGMRRIDGVTVTGVELELEIDTEQAVFSSSEDKPAWAELANGPLPIDQATLRLEVLGESNNCAEVEPWGAYQAGASRDGLSRSGGSLMPPSDYEITRIGQVGIAGPVDEIFASAAADLNADGNDDLVVLEGQGSIVSLTVFGGPDMGRRESVSLPGAPAIGAVMVSEDEQNDSSVVYVSAPVDATTLSVRAFTGSLIPIWETTVPAAGATDAPFPPGGPFLATFSGMTGPAIIVASGNDVVALNAADGALLWQLSSTGAMPAGWIVTGTAAADMNGDGSDEIAVGLRNSDPAPTGRVMLINSIGAELWSWPATAAIVGAPVMVIDGVSTPSIAVVQTPLSPDESSVMILLEAAGGTPVWQTSTAFWARFQPAAADLDGDGLTEYAIGSGDPSCSYCTFDGMLAIDDDGSVLWWNSNHPVPAAAPIAMDIYGSGDVDLVSFNEGGGYGPEVVGWQGEFGWWLAWGEADIGPLQVLDIDGDCQPEIASGRFILRGVETGPPEKSDTPESLEREVLWSWEGPVDLAPGELARIDEIMDIGDRTGFFVLRGELSNELGQVVARKEAPFSVVESDIELSLDALADAHAVDSAIPLSGFVRNAGNISEELSLELFVDEVLVLDESFLLGPGEEATFNQPLMAETPGLHRVVAQVGGYDGGVLAEGEKTYLVEIPEVTLEINAPERVGTDVLQIEVEISNPTHLSLEVEVDLSPSGDAVTATQLQLESGEQELVVFECSLRETQTYVVTISGDAENDATFEVLFDATPELELISSPVTAAGQNALRIRASNTGTQELAGDLAWQLDDGSGSSGSVPLRLAPSDSEEIDLVVVLNPGLSTLRLELLDHLFETEIEAYVRGKGSLLLDLPETATEGTLPVAITITNLLDDNCGFEIEFEARDRITQNLVDQRTIGCTLAGGEARQETVELQFAPGVYDVTGTLLSDASAQIDVGQGTILGLSTDKTITRIGETVVARVDLQGSASGQLDLKLDGLVVYSEVVSLNGIKRVNIDVDAAVAGEHQLEAVLDAGGLVSRATTSFSIFVVDEPCGIFCDGFESSNTSEWSAVVQ